MKTGKRRVTVTGKGNIKNKGTGVCTQVCVGEGGVSRRKGYEI